MKKHSTYLYLNKHGVYYYRQRIPSKLTRYFEYREIKFSLKTKNKTLALTQREHYRLYFQNHFNLLEENMDSTDKEPKLRYFNKNRNHSLPLDKVEKTLNGLYTLRELFQNTSGQTLLENDHKDLLMRHPTTKMLVNERRENVIDYIESEIKAIETAIKNQTHTFKLTNELNESVSKAKTSLHSPTTPSPQQAQTTNETTLSKLIDEHVRWQLKDNKWSQYTQEKNTPKLTLLLDILGDVSINTITRSSARDAREILKNWPKNVTRIRLNRHQLSRYSPASLDNAVHTLQVTAGY